MLVRVRSENRLPYDLPALNFRFQLTPDLGEMIYSHPKDSEELRHKYRCFSNEDLLHFVIENGGHMEFLKLILKKADFGDSGSYYRLARDTFQLVKSRKAIRLISRALLRKKPDLNLAMMMRNAVYYGKRSLIQLLLKYNMADPNHMYMNHVSLLTLAVSNVSSADHFPNQQADKRVVGDTRIIKTLLAAGAHVDGTAPGRHGSPLMWCIRTRRRRLSLHKKLKVIKLLLEAGADVNIQDRYTWSPLVRAIYSTKSMRVCSLLLEAGAQVNDTRFPALEAALDANVSYNLLRLLLQHGASLDEIPAATRDHNNPLLFLFYYSERLTAPALLRRLKLLHEWGVSLRHALRLAVYCDVHCFKEIADYVLQFEDLDDRLEEQPVQFEPCLTSPLLECALREAGRAYYGTREMAGLQPRTSNLLYLLQVLVEQGVNINETTGKKGILAVAAKYHTFMIPHLLEAGVDLQKDRLKSAMFYLVRKMKDQSDIRTYYYSAEEYKHYIQLLLNHGFVMTEQHFYDRDINCLAITQFVEYKFQNYFRQLFRRLVLPHIPVQASRVKLKDVDFVAQMVQAKYSNTVNVQPLLRQKFGVDSLSSQELLEWVS